MLRQIRSRYKALCASLGVRPRLHAAAASDQVDDTDTRQLNGMAAENVGGSSIPVWKVDTAGKKQRVTNEDLAF